MKRSLKLLLPAILFIAIPAHAHTFGAHGAGLAAGLAHPLLGFDHLLAMVAVGMWAAQTGGCARWIIPLAFMIALAAGATLAMTGVALPQVETGIAASVLALGLLIAASVRLHPIPGCLLVAFFALFHGHAHGNELPQAASAGLYAFGFMTSTAALHLTGLFAGNILQRIRSRALAWSGMPLALSGAWMLTASLG